ncbi:chemotaxis protein CheA [Holophaga foetida]|uniref:chemotaxis protein CheA n=1 Tax=Holophaga foetida TaxID=35839 RepID=UPI00024750D1|nr:chemotaxis protein CheA [Holophaga foetida]
MDLDQAKQTFIIEAHELLDAMEESLLAPESSEAVNAMFRAVHTIKGSAGLFGLDPIVRFAHTVESVMDRVRAGSLAFDPDLVNLILACHDHLAQQISELQEGDDAGSPETIAEGDALLARLLPYLETVPRPAAPPTTLVTHESHPHEEEDDQPCWHISIRFGPDILRQGMDPLSFLRYLQTLGSITHLTPLLDRLPAGPDFDPERCYLGLEIDLDTKVERQVIEDVFEFVREDSQIRIIPPRSKVEEYIQLIRELPEGDHYLGEILVKGKCLTPKDLEEALGTQRQEAFEDGTVQGRMLGTIVIQDQAVPPAVVAAALDKQKKAKEKTGHEVKVVKVQAEKLDRLVDLVGELVIAGATANTLAAQGTDSRVLEATAILGKLVEEIRDNALSLRMVQIGETFSRFRRIVRDVGQELGKPIELEIRGAETELDKSIVEKLSDPLMHVVRNSIDHGIESQEVRRARGKPATGSLSLNAFHESGSIVIEVADDGGGLNKQRILAKAVERGLVQDPSSLTDQDITNLIFEPGFSTADAVSNLSGRGVGMDVVKRNIDELRGTIEVETYEGAGTTLRFRLPLTLAIIDGFRVGVEDTFYVIPLDMVIECLDLGPFLESEQNHLINLRGEVLPFLRLREVFETRGAVPARERVVVVQFGELRAGIVVDRLMGEFQTVIKPLGELFRSVKGLGGSTILGSGEVALILDVPQLIQLAVTRKHALQPRLSTVS